MCLVHFKVSSLYNYFINVLTGPSNMVLPNIFPRNACWSYLFILFLYFLTLSSVSGTICSLVMSYTLVMDLIPGLVFGF